MKIAAHITFFYVKERLIYLNEVVNNLLEIDHSVDVYIHTNILFDAFNGNKNVKYVVANYPKKKSFWHFSYNSIFNRMGFKSMIHPYFLTWENRKLVEQNIDNYDVQIYIEDDIKFTKDNFNYWLNNHEEVMKAGYNLGFLRIEKDNAERFLTDLHHPIKDTLALNNKKYLINNENPYYGFWIYAKEELSEFIKSDEWSFKFKGYGIREKSAIGWHGIGMSRYKESIIPLQGDNNQLKTVEDCAVHHIPNNYINHEFLCKEKFPIVIN